MKTAAVITEYNPFHNGHLYQLNKIRESGVDCIIIVMSGNFTQRGIPAIYDKFSRTAMALENGADLIFELPVYYATGSAEFFARGAITLLDKLGVVDELYFGSESGEIMPLQKCADIFLNEPSEYKKQLSLYLKNGNSFPKARSLAISDYLGNDMKQLGMLCTQPNNILGIEYIKELLRSNSTIIPKTIKREGASYHDAEISEHSGVFASANAIRSSMSSDLSQRKESLYKHVPQSVYQFMTSKEGSNTLFNNDFSSILLFQLSQLLAFGGNEKYYDMNQQLYDIIKKNIQNYQNWDQFILQCKSKEYTYTRLNRSFLHILLHMKQSVMDSFKEYGDIFYARLLGFTTNGAMCMKSIKQNSDIPIISKLADAQKVISSIGLESLKADLYASNIYYGVLSQKYHTPIENEYQKEIIRK